MCEVHGDQLTHFCEDERRPACFKCRNPKKHTANSFRLIVEAAADHKKELKTKLRPLHEKLRCFLELKFNFEQTVHYIKNQAEQTEHLIKEEFEKLHEFLREEEALRLSVLTEEEEQSNQMMKKKMDELEGEIASLSDKINALEAEIRSEDLSFLQNYKAVVERLQYSPQEPEPISGEVLIHVAKHLGNLMFHVSQKLQTMVPFNPVHLDPNTAHSDLIVSADLTSVAFSEERQMLPNNPERFTGYTSVLGSQGFTSGTHCWDIEVGDSTAWAVGVIAESVYRKRETHRFGLWYVGFLNGKYGKGYSPEILTLLRVSQKIQRIRVQLDCDKGKVSFSDATRNTCLHVFKHNFSETVYPYFYNHCKQHSLRILPVRSFVTVEQFSS